MIKNILNTLENGFVSSCQPVDGGAMDNPIIVSAMAEASIAGGAVGIRIEGIENLRATRPKVQMPIIGIIKRDLPDSPVRITPFLADIDALKDVGADIIAIDATDRTRPVDMKTLVERIQSIGCIAMADCSTYEEGMYAKSLGVEIISTTMSGYVQPNTPKEPDFEMVSRLREAGCWVMAEGRYNSPELAAQAIKAGAHCVTVGSAITRVEHICSWFDSAIKKAKGE